MKVNIVFQKDFEEFKVVLKKCVDDITTKLGVIDVTFAFYSMENRTEKFEKSLRDIAALPKEHEERMINLFRTTEVPFSWGWKNKEFVFMGLALEEIEFLKSGIQENDELAIQPIRGLMAHELIHSIQRQRGFEDDLRRSMQFSSSFFEELGKFLPYGTEAVVQLLENITEMAVLTLKDLYANAELIEMNESQDLLSYYFVTFGVGKACPIPSFEVSYDPGETVDAESLKEFVGAASLAMATLPHWLPFMGKSPDAQVLREHIEECYEGSRTLSREFRHLYDLYLTSFAYSKEFHTAFFTRVFIIVLEYLSGESFSFEHLAAATEQIEILENIDEEEKTMILNSVLKAAHLLALKSNIQETYRIRLRKLMRERIPPAELEDWMESYEEYFPFDLLKLPTHFLLKVARRAFLLGKELEAKQALQAFFFVLQAMEELQEEERFKVFKQYRKEVRSLLSRDDPGKLAFALKLLPLEIATKREIYEDPFDLVEDQVQTLIMELERFRVPLKNETLNVALEIAKISMIVLSKDPSREELPGILGLALFAIDMSDKTITKHSNSLIRSVLLALGIDFETIRATISVYNSNLAIRNEANMDSETTEE